MLRFAVSLGLALFGLQSSATEVLITGVITRVESDLTHEFGVGQPYSYRFTWTGPGLDVLPSQANVGLYPSAGAGLTLTTPDYVIQSDKLAYTLVDNNISTTWDTFYISASLYLTSSILGAPLVGSHLIGDRFPYDARLEFEDRTALALTSADLLDPAPILADYQFNQLVIGFAREVTPFAAFGVARVFGNVESVQLIPEPSTLDLALAAAAGLIVGSSRRRRAQS